LIIEQTLKPQSSPLVPPALQCTNSVLTWRRANAFQRRGDTCSGQVIKDATVSRTLAIAARPGVGSLGSAMTPEALLNKGLVEQVIGAARLLRLMRAGWITLVERRPSRVLFSARDVRAAVDFSAFDPEAHVPDGQNKQFA